MSRPVLVLASHNKGKLAELRAILDGAVPGLDVNTQVVDAASVGAPDVRETGVSFEENALLKAREVAEATGLVAVSDDSGLSVDVLGGAPGFLSARWAGAHGDDVANLELLLAQLSDIGEEHRGAAFVCAAGVAVPGGEELVRFGELRGSLATAPRGEGGFGYDPILIPEGLGLSCAEISAEEKNAISHRGKAFRALVPELTRILADRL